MIGSEALSIHLPAGQQLSPSLKQHLLENYLLTAVAHNGHSGQQNNCPHAS